MKKVQAVASKATHGQSSEGSKQNFEDANHKQAENTIIVAVAEGRREQAGIAIIDSLVPSRIKLVRVSESSIAWRETVDIIQCCEPPTILIADSQSQTALGKKLSELVATMPNTQICKTA